MFIVGVIVAQEKSPLLLINFLFLSFVFLFTFQLKANEEPFIVTSSGWKQSVLEVGDFHLSLDQDKTQKQNYEGIVKDNVASLGESIGGEGNPIFVGLRGFSSEHTQIIEDGVIQRDLSSPSGVLPLSEIFSTPVDRVEVVYGSHASRWGGGALGGVIHFISPNRPSNFLNLSTGSYQSYKLNGLYKAYETPMHHLSIQGTAQVSEGFSTADGGSEKDGYQNYGGRLFYSRASSKSLFRVSSSLSYRKQDVDAFGGAEGDLRDYSIDTSRFKLLASYEKQKSKAYQYKTYLQLLQSNRLNNSPQSVWNINPKIKYTGLSIDIGYQSLWKISKNIQFNSYIHWYHDGLDIDFLEQQLTDHHQRGVFQYGSEIQASLHSYFIKLGALSGYSLKSKTNSSYKLSIGRKSKGAFYSRAFLNISRGSKLPSLYQLNDRQYGNHLLETEYSTGAEATFGFGSKFFDIQFAWYQFFLFNFIDFDLKVNQYQNLAKVRFQGFQFVGSVYPEVFPAIIKNKLTLKTNIQESKNLRTNQVLPGRPELDASINLTFQWSNLSLLNSLHYAGERVGFNGTALDDYMLWNTSASYQWKKSISFQLNLRNILNTTYEISPGFKQPGRNWQLSMSWKL